MEKLVVASSPHIQTNRSTRNIMLDVILALVPTLVVSVFFFGIDALLLMITSVAACAFFEYTIQVYLLKQKSSIHDCSAMLTGLLLGLNLPSGLPLWIVVIGALVAIGIGKMSFGGIGKNPFNPAIVGRVFLLLSFPAQMTTWPAPSTDLSKFLYHHDAITGATPLALIKQHFGLDSEWGTILYNNMGSSVGEISALALILGGIYLLYRRVISWHIPVSIILSLVMLTGLMHLIDASYASPLVHVFSGGLLIGAIYMATDYSSSPMTHKGMIIYGVGIGIITAVIRLWGSYPEGMSFAILIMNAFTPIINTYCKPKRFSRK